jgi:hypothetical protein
VIDVTRRSIEETAAELMNMLTIREEQQRDGQPKDIGGAG